MKINEIQKEYLNLTEREKINILWSAIENMQQYNGRSRWYCVALAMGYESDDGENYEKFYYKIN